MKKIILTFGILLIAITQAFSQLQVVTNPLYVRGATKAFGRSTVTGVATSNLQEQGFCWSTQPDPTILDNRTTLTYSNNGNIYRMEGLTPSTVYYARAYAITKDSTVAYGDVIKIITIPQGNATYTYNSGSDAAANTRVIAALNSAVAYYCDWTSIQGYHVTCNYNAGTPTADCSYGGWMNMGPSSDYQRTGTVLHEMAHGVGVGQHTVWYGPNSPMRSGGTTGLWLGERAINVLRFLENKPGEYVTGDTQHFWPASNSAGSADATSLTYGINGSWEDSGNELLYIGNCAIVQAFGEDGLPPTGGFATPAYTFLHDDSVKYYIKSESDMTAQNVAFLKEDASGNLANSVINAESAFANDSVAWYLRFNPVTCYYQIINVATGKYFTYKTTGTNGVTLTTVTAPLSNNSFQLMGARNKFNIGIGSNTSSVKGYWIVRPQAVLNPPCFASGAGQTTTVATFNFGDAAANQRWLFLTQKEVQEIIDPEPQSPTVTATPITSTWINLSWSPAASARSYRIYRASYPDSVYSVLRNSFTGTNYDDNFGMTPNTIYWYKVCSVNNSGESVGVPVKAITNKSDGEPGDGITAINKVTEEDFKLYPNPVKAGQRIFVETDDAIGKPSVEIMDTTGKTVLRFPDNQFVYAPQTKGIYFLKFITKQKTKIFKLIVN